MLTAMVMIAMAAGMMTMMMIIHLIGGIKRRIHIHLVTMKMIMVLAGMMMGIRGCHAIKYGGIVPQEVLRGKRFNFPLAHLIISVSSR